MDERLEVRIDGGDDDDIIGQLRQAFVRPFGNGDNGSTASSDLLKVAKYFVSDETLGNQEDAGSIGIDQSDWAMLHFRGGVSFRMDVADFFQFECAFEGDGEVELASQVKEVRTIPESLRNRANLVPHLQHSLDLFG